MSAQKLVACNLDHLAHIQHDQHKDDLDKEATSSTTTTSTTIVTTTTFSTTTITTATTTRTTTTEKKTELIHNQTTDTTTTISRTTFKAKSLKDLIVHRKGRVTSKYQAEEENTILPILETTTKTTIRIEIIRRKKIKVFEIKFICKQQDQQLKIVRGKKKERCHIQNQHSKKKEEKVSNKINSMSKEKEEYYMQNQHHKKKEEKVSNKEE